jgi:hypothetical protein
VYFVRRFRVFNRICAYRVTKKLSGVFVLRFLMRRWPGTWVSNPIAVKLRRAELSSTMGDRVRNLGTVRFAYACAWQMRLNMIMP